MKAIEENAEDKPYVYGCNLLVCDSELRIQGKAHPYNDAKEYYRKNEGRVFTNVQGCTLVWNAHMQKLLEIFAPDTRVAHHDSWVNVLANCHLNGGKFIYDPKPHIYYRIHGRNASGYSANQLIKLIHGLEKYWGRNHPRRNDFAAMILDNYRNNLDKNSVEYHTLILASNYKKNFMTKIALAKSQEFKRMSIKNKLFQYSSILMERW